MQDLSKIHPEEISTYKEKETEDYRTEQKEMNSKGQEKSQDQENIAMLLQSSDVLTLTGLLISATSFLYTNLIRNKWDVLEIYTWQLKVNLCQMGRVSDTWFFIQVPSNEEDILPF